MLVLAIQIPNISIGINICTDILNSCIFRNMAAREMGQGLIGQGQASLGHIGQDQAGLGQIGQGHTILGPVGLTSRASVRGAMAKRFRAAWANAAWAWWARAA